MSKKKKVKEVKMSVYLLKLTSKEGAEIPETMYKIGRTSRAVEARVKEISKAYDVDVVETIELPKEDAMRLEKSIHHDYWKYKYYPKVKFAGMTEVFKNKQFFRLGNILKNFWEVINTPEEKLKYYKEKEARAEASKQRYIHNKWG